MRTRVIVLPPRAVGVEIFTDSTTNGAPSNSMISPFLRSLVEYIPSRCQRRGSAARNVAGRGDRS